MKKISFIFVIIFGAAAAARAGVSLGWPAAVKKQVEKLDDAVLKDLKVNSAPGPIAAEAGNTAAEITWPAVAGAATYNLYWGVPSPAAKIAGVTSPYLLGGLVNGITYACTVTAVTRGAESNRPVPVIVTPTAARPASPANLAGAHGNGKITLTWSAVAGVTSYNVYWSPTPGVTTASAKISGVGTPTYTHNGLAQATRYYYRVSAVNGTTESLLTPETGVYTNRPPTVDTLTANHMSSEIGVNITLTATASDPDGDPLTYNWSAASGTLTGSGSYVNWLTPVVPGYYLVSVTASDGKGGSAQRYITIFIYSALDNPALTITSDGSTRWFAQTVVYYYGGASAQSGALASGQQNYIQTTVTGSGNLSFYWKLASAQSYSPDVLTLYIDGYASYLYLYGAHDWTQASIPLGTGVHVIRWLYAKNHAPAAGEAAWLDKVVFP